MVRVSAVIGDRDIDAAAEIDALYRAKAQAEIADAEALVPGKTAVRGQGDALAAVLLVKGEPGAADRGAGRALAGEDGSAAGKALDALGMPAQRFAVCTRPGRASRDALLRRLRMIVEAVDPRAIVALDPIAAKDLAEALGCALPDSGIVARYAGRSIVAVDGLEASLSDATLKRRVWRQLQALSGVSTSAK